jgi:hypothetical protein
MSSPIEAEIREIQAEIAAGVSDRAPTLAGLQDELAASNFTEVAVRPWDMWQAPLRDTLKPWVEAQKDLETKVAIAGAAAAALACCCTAGVGTDSGDLFSHDPAFNFIRSAIPSLRAGCGCGHGVNGNTCAQRMAYVQDNRAEYFAAGVDIGAYVGVLGSVVLFLFCCW